MSFSLLNFTSWGDFLNELLNISTVKLETHSLTLLFRNIPGEHPKIILFKDIGISYRFVASITNKRTHSYISMSTIYQTQIPKKWFSFLTSRDFILFSNHNFTKIFLTRNHHSTKWYITTAVAKSHPQNFSSGSFVVCTNLKKRVSEQRWGKLFL